MIRLLLSLIFALCAGQIFAHPPASSTARWQAVTNTATLGSITESKAGIYHPPEFLTLGSYLRAWRGLAYLLDPNKPLMPKLWTVFAAVAFLMICRFIARRKP